MGVETFPKLPDSDDHTVNLENIQDQHFKGNKFLRQFAIKGDIQEPNITNPPNGTRLLVSHQLPAYIRYNSYRPK